MPDLIDQGKAHFDRRADERFDGFEVWDGKRRVYWYPEDSQDPKQDAPANRDG